MMIASVMFAVMNTIVYQTKIWHADESPMMASFIRVLVNLVIVVVLSYVFKREDGRTIGLRGLFGDQRKALWLRGIFGTLSVIAVFYSVHEIGVGEASFLNASNAIWVGLLSPLVLKQRNSMFGWLALGLGFLGLFLIYQPDFSGVKFLGRTVAIVSGFFGACAYLLVSRAGRSNHHLSVVFYFTLVATGVHLVWFVFQEPVWPRDSRNFMFLILAGFAASFAQVFMTKAYQEAPAMFVSATSYLGPVVSLVLGVVLFSDVPSSLALAGATLIVISGMTLPFIQHRKWKQEALTVKG